MMLPLHPLGDTAITVGGDFPLTIDPLPDCTRFSLRIDPQMREAAGTCFGLELPAEIGALTRSGNLGAVKLGPDEWYLLAAEADRAGIEARFTDLGASQPHSLVDVSHREVGIGIEGRDAALLLQSSIAFDIEKMQPGTGCRTIFDRVQIILLREDADRFRIEVWHSFSEHVWHFLGTVAREIELSI